MGCHFLIFTWVVFFFKNEVLVSTLFFLCLTKNCASFDVYNLTELPGDDSEEGAASVAEG